MKAMILKPLLLSHKFDLKTVLSNTFVIFAVLMLILAVIPISFAQSPSLPSYIKYDVPITLTNSQPTATPAPFQQMIQVPNSNYSSNEASNLQNIAFYDSARNVIPSWLESGNSSSLNDTYWVSLANGIPADANVTIYMGFANVTTNLLNTQTTGEAPQLSQVYGAYDDGAAVFSFYDNFAGTTLSSQWTNYASNSGNIVTVNNEITVAPSTAANSFPAIYSNEVFGQGIVDFCGTIPIGGRSDTYTFASIGLGSTTDIGDDLATIGSLNGNYGLCTSSATRNFNYATGLVFGSVDLYSIIIPSSSPNSITAQVNYQSTDTVSSSVDLPTLPQSIIFENQEASGITIGPIYWIRVRAYPPAGVMPAVAFESIEVTSEFPSFLILPLFMIATLLAVIVYKKKGKTGQS